MVCVSVATMAQNTKGDKPAQNRESRFKTPARQGSATKPKNTQKRVPPRNSSTARSARLFTPRAGAPSGGDRPGKPIRPIVRTKPNDKQKAWKGDIAGYRIRTKPSTGSSQNVYPQYGRYSNNSSRKPKPTENAVSNRSTIARLNRLQGSGQPPPSRKGKVVPRSASGSYIARKSINVYASFPRPKRKGEQATTKDLAGRRLRTRNYETKRPGVIAPTYQPYYGRKKNVGDRPYKGPAAGSYRSATRSGERAWRGDVTGRPVRGRNYSSKRTVEGMPMLPPRRLKDRSGDRPYRGAIPGVGYKSATRSGESRPGLSALPARAPGIGARGVGNYQGNMRVRQRMSDQGEGFSGGIKTRRPLKGGGSVSGKLWNNDGQAISVRTPKQGAAAATFQGNTKVVRRMTDQGEGFSGSIKTRRPLKGGGSVSGKLWNNDGQPISVRTPKQGALAATYQGNTKVVRSITDQGEGFSGSIKTRRPLKGGGSVSGKLWNNDETPIAVRPPSVGAEKAGQYTGNIPIHDRNAGLRDQGEEFTGYKRLKKFRKDYIQNPNASEESIVKQRPHKSTYQVAGLQVKVKERESGIKPGSPEGVLPTLKPSKSTIRASEYASGVKRDWDYIRNPSSSSEALRTREPGKAFGKSTDYQGNIKMQKFTLYEKNRSLHPDAKFVRLNKNNVPEEKDLLTNFKLWWARLFKKQENQPDHLKEKGNKPRYDKGEIGLWYD